MEKPRTTCAWADVDDPLIVAHHDLEWGVPVHDDRLHFEFLILEAAQAGLSWSTILNKREGYRRAFDNFDAEKVARYTDKRVRRLIADPAIVRNRMKIEGAVRSARAFIATRGAFGSFDAYCWRFVNGRPKVNRWRTKTDVPTTSAESDTLSKDLKRRGFAFVGSTIVYAYMQSVGMVNDHLVGCFRHKEVQEHGHRRRSVAQDPAVGRGDRRGVARL